MTRLLIFFFSAVLLFSACKKDDDYAFQQTPDERINEALSKYETALTGSATGWNATIRTGTGGIYHFYFRFNNANRVFMYADINLETASTLKESSYRLKALQLPTLIFDTYSYLHILSDPDGNVNGGATGQGLVSDFEFSIDSLVGDSLKLTGRVNNTKLTLVKASQQDLDDWQNGQWAKILAFENISKIQNYFKRLTVGGKDYEMRVNIVARTITFIWIDGSGNVQQFTTTYTYTSDGILFTNPFNTGSQTINGLEVSGWDGATFTINVKVNGVNATIHGATQPLKIDLTAPSRWYQSAITNNNTYYASGTGFFINGVTDAFAIKTLSRYYFLIYWPKFDPANDLFAPVFINEAGTSLELLYGAAPDTPQFTGDGRAIFTLLGTYGTYPTSGPALLTLNQMLLPQGYYFVQTGQFSYDMVSATDAKAWVSWEMQ